MRIGKVCAVSQGGFLNRSLALLIVLGLSTAAHANESSSRAWDFNLKTPGIYKVQVEHPADGSAPSGTKVTYSIQIGKESQSRELELVAGHPYIPLIMNIPDPEEMRVVVAGLPKAALQRTRVYVFDENSQFPGEYFDPSKSVELKEAKRLRAILQQRSEDIDLARAKVMIDKMVDPRINVEATLQKIDAMTATIRAMPEFGPTNAAKVQAIRRYIYAPGAWNDNKPFQYDLGDPLGTKVSNKLLSTYIATKKGNCVTMPFLFVILAQRLGLDATASTAPLHFLVKVKDDSTGAWVNLEATSGANPARDVWIRQQNPMTDEAITNGLYLQPLTRKETIAVMGTVIAEHYFFERQEFEKAMTIADVVLEYYPKDVNAMTMKGAAYARLIRRHFAEKYPTPDQIPDDYQGYYTYLAASSRQWFSKAEALGWREQAEEEDDKYLQRVNQDRQQR